MSTPQVQVWTPLNRDEASVLLAKARQNISVATDTIKELRNRRGYKALGYKNWSAFVKKEFGITIKQLSRYLLADDIRLRIAPDGDIKTLPEGVIRPLNKLPEDKQAEAYQQAETVAASIPGKDGKPRSVTRGIVEIVVDVNQQAMRTGHVDDGSGMSVPATPDNTLKAIQVAVLNSDAEKRPPALLDAVYSDPRKALADLQAIQTYPAQFRVLVYEWK